MAPFSTRRNKYFCTFSEIPTIVIMAKCLEVDQPTARFLAIIHFWASLTRPTRNWEMDCHYINKRTQGSRGRGHGTGSINSIRTSFCQFGSLDNFVGFWLVNQECQKFPLLIINSANGWIVIKLSEKMNYCRIRDQWRFEAVSSWVFFGFPENPAADFAINPINNVEISPRECRRQQAEFLLLSVF